MLLEKLNEYVKEGLVYNQVHPTLPLTIWNYTPLTQYEDKWDDVTIICRGLVTDNEGNIVARPFKKFFNWEENKHTPTENFEVYDKLDGSLIIVFHYNGEWVVASRGSFTSDQSIAATKIFNGLKNIDKLDIESTYIFELIAKWNRIVVDYGDVEKLVLLGINSKVSEYTYEGMRVIADILGCDIVKKYDGIKDYSTLKGMIGDNEEGFVVRFSNGDRMKIKGEEYLRLHKIMTNLSTTAIWEVLSNNGNMDDLLKDVPDEFYKKIKQYEGELRYGFYQISEYCGKIHDYFRYGKYNDVDPEPTKKEFAEYIMKNYKKFSSVMFAMWDKRPYDHIIWKMLKPKFEKI